MPSPTLRLDRIENAKIQVTLTGVRITRAWIATDIDTSVPSQALYRLLVIAGMPGPGTLFPGSSFWRVTDYTAVPISGTAVKGTSIYTGPVGDEIPLFVAEKTSSLVQRQREYFNDGSGWKPIQVQLDIPPAVSGGTITTLTKTAGVPVMSPTSVVTLSRFQAPPPSGLPRLGSVNSNVMSGYLFNEAAAVGFWLFAGLELKTTTMGANYDYRITLMSLVEQDWSDFALLRQPNGEPVVVTASTMNTLLGLGYTNDLVQGTDVTSLNAGIAKVGVYQLADMTAFLSHNLSGL